ncbi:MAG: hypothetical protein FWH01_04170 [Oscillospiraceae bacterium]|nr:hypothetical protein [Oscillospiraceae bacterium]
MIKQYDKVKLKDGKYAIIVEVLESEKAYIADIQLSEGDYTTETIMHSDIVALIVEVERPIAI